MNKHYVKLINFNVKKALALSKNAEDIRHLGIQGRAREIFLKDLLLPFLNPSIGICTGVIVDSDGNQSNQIDLIIYSKNLIPPIMLTVEEGMVPCESVLATIEVKTTLTSDEMKKSVLNARSAKVLKPHFYEFQRQANFKSSIVCCVFAYKSKRKPENEIRLLKKHVDEANKNSTNHIHVPISALCVGNSLFARCEIQNMNNPATHQFRTFKKNATLNFLSFLWDTAVGLSVQRSPMLSSHYFKP